MKIPPIPPNNRSLDLFPIRQTVKHQAPSFLLRLIAQIPSTFVTPSVKR